MKFKQVTCAFTFLIYLQICGISECTKLHHATCDEDLESTAAFLSAAQSAGKKLSLQWGWAE